MKLFDSYWQTLILDIKGKQVEQAICVIAVASLTALVITFVLGISLSKATPSYAGGLIAVVTGMAAWGVGGLLGLLFGNPRFAGVTNTAKPAPQSLQPNNGLEKVSEWLTTMIIGLGLVNLKTIGTRANEFGQQITASIVGVSWNAAHADAASGIPGMVLCGAFVFLGFTFVFLWTLRFLPGVLTSTYATQAQVDDVRAAVDGARADIERFRTSATFPVRKEELLRLSSELLSLGVDDATEQEIIQRYSEADRWASEPMEDFGPARSAPYSLTATVVQVDANIYRVTVRVTSDAGPLTEKCLVLIHNSFTQVSMPLALSANYGECAFQASGAFWVGAVVVVGAPQPAVRLAYDLAKIPGVPDTFT